MPLDSLPGLLEEVSGALAERVVGGRKKRVGGEGGSIKER